MSTQVEAVVEASVVQEQDVSGAVVAPVVDRGLVAQLVDEARCQGLPVDGEGGLLAEVRSPRAMGAAAQDPSSTPADRSATVDDGQDRVLGWWARVGIDVPFRTRRRWRCIDCPGEAGVGGQSMAESMEPYPGGARLDAERLTGFGDRQVLPGGECEQFPISLGQFGEDHADDLRPAIEGRRGAVGGEH